MKKINISNKMTRTVNMAGLKLKKRSPEILLALGVVGTVVSTVTACKATTKISIILDTAKEDIASVHECKQKEELKNKYTLEDSRKDLAIIYTQTGVKLVRLYAPAIILGTMSITSILASNNILRKRNMAIAAAYATVDKSFKEYRGRVVEKFGEEIDRELKYNIKAKEIEEAGVDKKGKEITVKKEVQAVDPNMYSEYARFFDDGCAGWEKDSEYNLMLLKSEQNYANDRLKARGYLFLNEVYERLGIPPTKAGQCVGWIYNPDHPVGDNFVDFGIYDLYKEKNRDFVNGYERTILLDFNVDGDILDLI